jgi:phage FluMu protein Com
MNKTVPCKKCKRVFHVEGTPGMLKEVDQRIACPYCKELNDISWAPDATIRAVPYKGVPL